MSVLEVSNYLLGKMDYLSRIKSDNSNKILKYIESFVWMINHAGNRRLSKDRNCTSSILSLTVSLGNFQTSTGTFTKYNFNHMSLIKIMN